MMERGPMALFGAIIAVGLGPAMWLGAQFGVGDATPTTPPAIIVDRVHAPGGAGAGAEPDGTTQVVDTHTDSKRRVRPAAVTATVRPTPPTPRTTTSPTDRPTSAAPSVEPSTTGPVDPTDSVDPSPDTESTGEPATPSTPRTTTPVGPLGVTFALGQG
jgi:hypothetical protein